MGKRQSSLLKNKRVFRCPGQEHFVDRFGNVVTENSVLECEEDILDTDDNQISNWFKSRPYCSSGRTQIVIAPDGKVVTCKQSPQEGRFVCGDVKHQSIMEVWNSEALKKWYAPPREEFQGTACFDCDEFQPCIHGMGHYWLQVLKMQGREYGPHPYCPKGNKPKQHWR